MAHSDSEGETIDDLEFETRITDGDAEEENDIDEDLLGALDNSVDEATEADEVCRSFECVLLEASAYTGLSFGRLRRRRRRRRRVRASHRGPSRCRDLSVIRPRHSR
jgi:hypothetical protein